MNIKKIFSVEVILSYPNEEGLKLDFRTKALDIFYAVEQFNANFPGFKSIKLQDIKKDTIKFLFDIEVVSEDVIVNARDITVFSKRLFHDRGWSKYSAKDTKLFTGNEFEDVTEQYISNYDKIEAIPSNLLLKISHELNIEINEKLDDAQAVKALQALISIQDIGSNEIKSFRKDSLVEIKRILLETLS